MPYTLAQAAKTAATYERSILRPIKLKFLAERLAQVARAAKINRPDQLGQSESSSRLIQDASIPKRYLEHSLPMFIQVVALHGPNLDLPKFHNTFVVLDTIGILQPRPMLKSDVPVGELGIVGLLYGCLPVQHHVEAGMLCGDVVGVPFAR